MPAYPLYLPASPAPTARGSRVSRSTKAAVSESPLSGVEQVYDWGVDQWHLMLEFPPIRETEAAAWHQFFYDIRGRVGTFSFNIDRYVKSTPAPGFVLFRLTENMVGWDVDLARFHYFTIDAREVK